MGFFKRYVNFENTLTALKSGKLKEYYGKADIFIFDDRESEQVHTLFVDGKTEKEILKLLNL